MAIIPTRKQEGPARESVKWYSPVRSEALSKIAKGANHLGVYQTRLHVDHQINRGQSGLLTSDPGAEPDRVHRVFLPATSQHVSHLEVFVRFQASEGFPSESDEAAGINFAGAELKVRLLTETMIAVDPPDPVKYAARVATPVGAAEGELGHGHLNPAALVRNDDDLGKIYPIIVQAFITPPPEVINQYPSGPRGLKCQANSAHVLEVSASRCRVWQIVVNEAPKLVV